MIILDVFSHFPGEFKILETCISAIVAFALGVVWYHPKIVGQEASAMIEQETKGFKPGPFFYVVALFFWFVTSSVYTFLISFLEPTSTQELLSLSTFLWVGFVLPVSLLNGLFSGKKLTVIGVDSSYFLAGLYLFAVIHDVI
jgi:hypothetical protein